ncbi:uncharacterized protein TNCV_4119771 [Trichonephila clavipes]|nr:uncharacterized protein TNCV_4119771 [Trichonephila clavipes]
MPHDVSVPRNPPEESAACDATAHEGQDLLCPSQYTRPLSAEEHEQMSRSGGQSEAKPQVFKSPSKHGTHSSLTALRLKVNGDRYRALITNFFISELNNHDVQELWFQQDGAIHLLKDTFGDRLISRCGPVNWPPRSCDLTPLDYFLWDYVKSLVYADKPQTLDYLEDNIRRVIADIRPQMLEKVIEN